VSTNRYSQPEVDRAKESAMKPAVIIARVLISLSGLALLLLGTLFWFGRALALLSLHIELGVVLVLCLWLLCALALRTRVSKGFILLVLGWSLLTPAFGVLQLRLLPGPYHWVIQVLHLAIGFAAVGLGQGLARRVLAPEGPAAGATFAVDEG
jgi:hypothetical protein